MVLKINFVIDCVHIYPQISNGAILFPLTLAGMRNSIPRQSKLVDLKREIVDVSRIVTFDKYWSNKLK